jgi:hypothetical protein
MIPIPPQLLLTLGTKVLPQLLGSVGSFAQAAAQKKAMDEAEREAAKAVAAVSYTHLRAHETLS